MGAQRARALRLNGDTSWLITLPFRAEDGQERTFNLVLDPWLDESNQIDMTFAFSVQTRVIKAVAGSLSEVDALIANSRDDKDDASGSNSGRVDALVLSHPFTDHAHPQTLTDRSNRTDLRLSGTPDALRSIRGLPGLPFKDVNTIPLASWDTSPLNEPSSSPLAPGIRIVRLAAVERFAALRYGPAWSTLHGGLAIVWQTEAGSSSSPRFGAIVYSPHGIMPASVPPWLNKAEPRILIHSLHRQTLPVWLAGPVSLGFSNALDLCRPGSFQPHLLLGTHDEHKVAGGIVSRLLRRQEWATQEMERLLKDVSPVKLRVLAAGEETDIQ
ncbi:unnamed protein product [Tilletia controversa]|nr:unnamed protein product [Tilletia controversa]CAD6923920.1 unnamed protein product [Tilletia controversa]CAD6942889.1 unnamed protein product [Tilletia controversa]CAD6977121.1 unnamed protein product [Tilletia controversa]CAD6979086.1 unnamed protein product [Tilletia controversa]